MKASDIMSLGAATITRGQSLEQAIRIMSTHGISALPVVDGEGRLEGIVSEGDFFRRADRPVSLDMLVNADSSARRRALASRTVEEIMTRDPIAIDADVPIEEAVELMERHELKRLPVMANDRVAGLISRADVLRAMIE